MSISGRTSLSHQYVCFDSYRSVTDHLWMKYNCDKKDTLSDDRQVSSAAMQSEVGDNVISISESEEPEYSEESLELLFYRPDSSELPYCIGSEKSEQTIFPAEYDREKYLQVIHRICDKRMLSEIKTEIVAKEIKGLNKRIQELEEYGMWAENTLLELEESNSSDEAAITLVDGLIERLKNINVVRYIKLSRRKEDQKYSLLGQLMLYYLAACGFFVPPFHSDVGADEFEYEYFGNGMYPVDTDVPDLDGKIKDVISFPYVVNYWYNGELCKGILTGECNYFRLDTRSVDQ